MVNYSHLEFLECLKATKKFEIIDFFFIAIDPKHQGRGIIAMMWEDGYSSG